ncbi:hypothetical protein [Variovorax sp.]|uniref:hypothetical protein n=1 Tax=Variovorax sp. TaxID=1871043 RepID=UPI002D7024D6|nr:hypothetical protein [Variovorax sp.]HYP85579.1 hypothetical protein [Variovorax sp.]
MRTPTPKGHPPDGPPTEEPEITQEESIPSDGKDKQVEKMMDELGRERREELDEQRPLKNA